jgi:hypothetical protein
MLTSNLASLDEASPLLLARRLGNWVAGLVTSAINNST